MTRKHVLILVAVIIFVGAWVIALLVPHQTVAREAPPQLRASAWRGPFAFTFMSREDTPARGCVFTIRDAAGDDWTAVLDRDALPMQQIEIAWSQFMAAGQPMPRGYASRGIVAACRLGEQVRTVGFGR